MGLYGAGFWSASVRSAATCVAEYSGCRLGSLFSAGNISVVSETCSEFVLVMYYVRHL